MEKLLKFFNSSLLIFGCLIFGCSHQTEDSREARIVSSEEVEELNALELMEKSVLINKAGDFHQGFKYLNQAVEIDPISHLGYRGWIRLRKLRDYEKALADFNQLDKLTPLFIDAPWGEDIDFLRGECYYGLRKYDSAIATFERSISNHGKNWVDIQTFIYLGLCREGLNDFEQAIEFYEQAIAINKFTPEAYYYAARICLNINQKVKALRYLNKAKDTFKYKREDVYNEFLNEIYMSDLLKIERNLR